MAPNPSDPMTAPEKMADLSVRIKAAGAAAPSSGVATDYWLELKPYPPGSARSLWLRVDGGWRHLDDPSPNIEASVQDAFCACPDRLEVSVWYSGSVIVGLVVRSK